MPSARLSIRHVTTMYCVCLSVLKIIPSPQQMVMWRVRIRWQVQEYWTSQIFMYNRTPPLMLLIILFIILGFCVEFPQFYINDSCPNCQIAAQTNTGWCYWCHLLLRPERVQLQNCLENALAELENWLKANKHKYLNHMSQAIKYIYSNLNIGCFNETKKFIIATKFLGVHIDNNLTW